MAGTVQTLHEDKRGAIMLTGLCMSCFLIGALWFIIGIGDAIVFRDTMQEAADHAAFTSAVLHAKGMNFIAACNLIMLAAITIHIIMGLINDILLATCIMFGDETNGAACVPYTNWNPVYLNYGKVFKPFCAVLHDLEVVAATGYPYIGAYKASSVGGHYGELSGKKRDLQVTALSPSMLPGGVMDASINRAFGHKGGSASAKPTKDASTRGSGKKGLPVEAKPYEHVCAKVAPTIKASMANLTGMGDQIGKVKKVLVGIIGKSLPFRYCNDLSSSTPDIGASITEASKHIDKVDQAMAALKTNPSTGGGSCHRDGSSIDPGLDAWWGCEGPLLPWAGTTNGSPWQQVWSMNVRPPYTDKQEHAVSIARRKMGVVSTAEPSTYFAEAEFYFDCTKEWSADECNGAADGHDDNAGYSIQWRARLKRLQFAEVGPLLSSFAGPLANGQSAYRNFTGSLKDKASGALGTTPLGAGALSSAVDQMLTTYVESPAVGKARDNDVAKALDPALEGAFH